jgi:hypothetical protein
LWYNGRKGGVEQIGLVIHEGQFFNSTIGVTSVRTGRLRLRASSQHVGS